jgi:hypothetical protein
MRTLLLFGLILAAMTAHMTAHAADFGELKPFTSDGCSLFPDGTPEHPKLWKKCCVVHDIAYWAGGTRDERRQADLELRDCVAATGHPSIAELMYLGVRGGGTGRTPTPFRWGYGWTKLRSYSSLTPEELRQVRGLIPQDLDQFI